jgi:glutathione S-transferase
MQGQANHFFRYAPEKIQYGIDRYINESRRLYRVLDTHLASRAKAGDTNGFLVGDHISIADITTIGWVIWAGWAGVDIEEFPNVKKWEEMMSKREGVSKGSNVPTKLTIKEKLKDKKWMEEYGKKAGEWIQKGMKEAKK